MTRISIQKIRRYQIAIAVFAFTTPLLSASHATGQGDSQLNPDEQATVSLQDSNLLDNGSFSRWSNGKPIGWEVGIGATDGANSPESRIAQPKEGGIELSGDGSSKAWKFLSQEIEVKAGDIVRFSFQAKSEGLNRQGTQKNNCFVGFVPTDASGQRLSPVFQNINDTETKLFDHFINCPASMTKAEVWIFLSTTGKLSVIDVKVEKLLPEDSFDMLVGDMGRHYSFFELKKIDWVTLTEEYREKATTAKSPGEFRQRRYKDAQRVKRHSCLGDAQKDAKGNVCQ